jgi:hypothetical protein
MLDCVLKINTYGRERKEQEKAKGKGRISVVIQPQ